MFTGKGEIFLSEKEEIDELRERINFIEGQKNELVESVLKMKQMVETLERRNGDLIDMTTLALKNYKKEEEMKKALSEEEKEVL